ncbi:deoxyribose-phosphate aldolase, partial [Piscirickettsia litoralis]|uniref:deoxyribose-phosphate aldolase n=1 Tax=Piscirickettsia litoralis TaxID=1891921 RepID=UPI001F38DE4D
MKKLCSQASNRLGAVAAVCVYPQFVSLAKKLLKDKKIQVATVVNFPLGNESADKIFTEIKQALVEGADEIDLVIPYQEYLQQGYSDHALMLVRESKASCQNKLLKVILETGELKSQELIFKAASDAIISGADFIKTSTGKTPVGATLEAVEVMLSAIKENKYSTG